MEMERKEGAIRQVNLRPKKGGLAVSGPHYLTLQL